MTIDEARAKRAQDRAERNAAKAKRLREKTAGSSSSTQTSAISAATISTTANMPGLVNLAVGVPNAQLPEGFAPLSVVAGADLGTSVTVSPAMVEGLLHLVCDLVGCMVVYKDNNGNLITQEDFLKMQENAQFNLSATPSLCLISKKANDQGQLQMIGNIPVPEEDVQRILAKLYATGRSGLQSPPPAISTPNQPAQTVITTLVPAGTATNSTAQPATPPDTEQDPPNFTELAAADLGYAPGANLSSLSPQQLAALTKRADELRQEYEAKQAKQELYETIVGSLLAAADRVIEWSDKQRQQAFMAKVDTLSRETEDDLSEYSEESRQLLELMDMMSQPTARKALTAAVNNPAFQQVLSALQPVAPVAPPQPPKNGGPLSGRALGRLLKSLECPNKLNHEDLLVRLSKLAQSNPEKLEEQLYREEIMTLLSYEEWRGLLDEGGLQYDPEHDPFDEEEEGGGADG